MKICLHSFCHYQVVEKILNALEKMKMMVQTSDSLTVFMALNVREKDEKKRLTAKS